MAKPKRKPRRKPMPKPSRPFQDKRFKWSKASERLRRHLMKLGLYD